MDKAARDFCDRYSLPERTQIVSIYDVFMFNDELDMLEVNLSYCFQLQLLILVSSCPVYINECTADMSSWTAMHCIDYLQALKDGASLPPS